MIKITPGPVATSPSLPKKSNEADDLERTPVGGGGGDKCGVKRIFGIFSETMKTIFERKL